MNIVPKKTGFSKPIPALVSTHVKHPILRRDLAVLVLDSEVDVLDEVAALLRRRDVTVHLATSTREAAELLQEHPDIGVVLADITMLEGEGLHIAADILNGVGPAIELVLICSTFAHDARSPHVMSQMGMLQEPLKLRDVAISVGRGLARAASRRNLPGSMSLSAFDRH
jgi:DNA-binding NtrC family response regulator